MAEIRDRQEMEKLEKQKRRNEGERGRDICPEGAKDCLWIGRRQMWPIGKWWFMKEEGNPMLGCGV